MAVAAVGLSVALSGCGGDASAGTPKLTRAAYLSRGNAICAAAAKHIKDAAPGVFPDLGQAGLKSPSEVDTYASTVVLPQLQHEYDQLHALNPPTDNNPVATLAALESGIDRWEKDKTLIADLKEQSFASFDALANDFGLTACSGIDGMVHTITTGGTLP